MSDQIIEVLEYLGDKLGIAIDWTAENVIPYAEQLFKRYVTLKITHASIGTFIGVICAVTAIILGVKLVKSYTEMKTTNTSNAFWYISKGYYCDDWDFTACGAVITIIAGICAALSIVALVISVPSLIEWIIIPEVPFVKEVAALLGTTI